MMAPSEFTLIRLLVQNLLQNPSSTAWSTQGLGMLRTYLTKEVRLHIWDDSLQVPGASPLHTHPWDLHSLIVAGVMVQNRYRESDHGYMEGMAQPFFKTTIKCGAGAYCLTEPTVVPLIKRKEEVYVAGQSYMQFADEIHWSRPENGTVTLVTRRFKEDTEHANVYWQNGPYVSAEPHPANNVEVAEVTSRALERWFQ